MSAPIAFAWLASGDDVAPEQRARWETDLGQVLAGEVDAAARQYETASAREDADTLQAAAYVHRTVLEAAGTWFRTGARWAIDPLRPPGEVAGQEQRRLREADWNELPVLVEIGLVQVWSRIGSCVKGWARA